MSRHRSARLLTAGALASACLYAVAPAPALGSTPAVAAAVTVTVTEQRIPVGPEPDQTGEVTLDTSVYTPGTTGPHAAVVLAHGFGGSKADVDAQARRIAAGGYVVLAYSARGFGASGGLIHLNDPAYEGKDVSLLLDWLAGRPDVLLDGGGDPRVAVVGGSYGGAIALIAAGTDPRVDVTVPLITWNDLAQSLFPQNAVGPTQATTPAAVEAIAEPGPFKQLWASRFFGSALAGGGQGGSAPSAARPAVGGGDNPLCGRFDPTVCALLLDAAQTGAPSPELLSLLRAHSPAPTLAKVTAPTLLIQGETDSLFGLDQADATARALTAAGVPVAVRWTDGGHDAPSTTASEDEDAIQAWLDNYLAPTTKPAAEPLPFAGFTYALPLARRATKNRLATLPAYPGLAAGSGVDRATLGLTDSGKGRRLLTPPGGQPASVTSIPGLGGLAATLPTYQLAALPGQSTAWDTRPADERLTVVGSPRLRLTVGSTGERVTLFVSLWKVLGETATPARPLVAPVSVAVEPGATREIVVALPAGAYTVEAGSTWRVLVTSTDSAFANPREARGDLVALTDAELELPTADGALVAAAGSRDTETIGLLAAIAGLLALLSGLALWRARGRRQDTVREDIADVPLVVDNLVKVFGDGHRAVGDVSWRAERGQVVGLLGPNGAGKTTTMRMLLGLIRPTSGEVHVLGRRVRPGSPVLGRVGALVEGPGFLPHLTGRENLHAYWRATGRPESEAGFEDALDVAALGGALDRPVRTYSHGMKQRLGIAQAMLGKPELLFLDEPTNGLDPPQIAAMRPILQSYAATGRTVVVSSHLLAEVEMTCSHVVVMHAGRVITSGTVADLVASEDTTVFELAAAVTGAEESTRSAALTAAERLRDVPGIRSVEVIHEETQHRMVVVADLPRAEVVRAALDAGADVVGVGSRRHLEEVFLGVIASAQTVDAEDGAGGSLIERLRQVRSR